MPKRFVSREKLCLSGITEYWVNDEKGLPIMVLTGELNEKLKIAIQEIILKILKEVPLPSDSREPVLTLVFDREAYEPRWFAKLWKEHRIAVLTYRKNVRDKWDESLFYDADMIPNYQNNILRIRLHSLSTPRANKAANKLCDFLNETETLFPTTNMRLVYETVAL